MKDISRKNKRMTSLSTKKWLKKSLWRLTFCCLGIVSTQPGYCSAIESVGCETPETNCASTAFSQEKNSQKIGLSSCNSTRRLHSGKVERSLGPRRGKRAGSYVATRNPDSLKIKTVCKLLEKALGSLKSLSQNTSKDGRGTKVKDKSSKPKPSFPYFPLCGCAGCCLMRPMIMYKVKYTPPKFKMKPLKAKAKCGHPHCGVYLGRKRR